MAIVEGSLEGMVKLFPTVSYSLPNHVTARSEWKVCGFPYAVRTELRRICLGSLAFGAFQTMPSLYFRMCQQ